MAETDFDLHDPHPDIHDLFAHYNELYFQGTLGATSVEWSGKRMTRCGGQCHYSKDGGCLIRLSEPLLKYRPSKETREVLLHEMIHAYLFLNKIRDSDHGPKFCKLMNDINTATIPDSQRPLDGYNITTRHSMTAEVESYQQHHWKCESCGKMVKRAMNRAPQETDCWGRMGKGSACVDPKCGYHVHGRDCGGSFIKVAEPHGYVDRRKKGKAEQPKYATADGNSLPVKRPRSTPDQGTANIMDYFERIIKTSASSEDDAQQHVAGSPSARKAARATGGKRSGRQAARDQAGSQSSRKAAEGRDDTPEQRRRLLAEAAMRRLQNSSNAGAEAGGASVVRASPEGGPRGGTVPEKGSNGGGLACADRSTLPSLGRSDPTRSGQKTCTKEMAQGSADGLAELGCVIVDDEGLSKLPGSSAPSSTDCVDLVADDQGTHGSEPSAQQQKGTYCPICGRHWARLEISNAELNAHVDACLASQAA